MLSGPMVFACIGYLKKVNTINLVMPLSFLILFIFMALRADSVGVDTKAYCWAFEQFRNINISEAFSATLYSVNSSYELQFEYGYRLYNDLLSVFGDSPRVILIANSVLILGLLYRLIKKYSAYPFFSIWLYITLGIFQTQMNMARNAIGILICYLAFEFIKEKKPIQYVLCILIAMSFHVSSILFLPIYWIVRNVPLTSRLAKCLFLCAIVVGVSFPLFRTSVLSFVPANYQEYTLGDTTIKYESLLLGAFHFSLVGLVYLFTNSSLRNQLAKLFPIGTWMFILDIFFYCVGLDWNIATRLAGLFGPFLIIYIPNLIAKGIHSRTKKAGLIVALVILCGAEYIIRLNFNNIGLTMPYEFYFL